MIDIGFGNKKKSLLGIDISSSSIKTVELVCKGDKITLKAFDIMSLPDGAVVDKNIVDVSAVGEALKASITRLGSKVSHAAAAVSGASVITKIIHVSSALSEEQLESQIEIEADQHIPYPLEDVALDFSIIGPSEKSEDTNDVLLVACRKETIDSVVDAFDIANLSAKVVDFEPYAQQRSLAALLDAKEIDEQAVVVLVDIGATATDVSILHDGHVVYNREQVFGGNQLVMDVAARYSLSMDEAERQVKRPELLPESAESDVLSPFRSQILQQITRSLQLFFAATNYNDVDVIVLSGGVAAMSGLQNLLQEDLGTQVVVASPLDFIDSSAVTDQAALEREAPSLMLAVGLALWGDDHYA